MRAKTSTVDENEYCTRACGRGNFISAHAYCRAPSVVAHYHFWEITCITNTGEPRARVPHSSLIVSRARLTSGRTYRAFSITAHFFANAAEIIALAGRVSVFLNPPHIFRREFLHFLRNLKVGAYPGKGIRCTYGRR